MVKHENMETGILFSSNEPNSMHLTSINCLQPDYLIVLYITTGGKQGEEMGCDESPIVLITARLINLKNRSVEYPEFQQLVCPFNDSTSTQSLSSGQITDSVDLKVEQGSKVKNKISTFCLSQDCMKINKISVEALLQSPSLEEALCKFDEWIQQNCLTLFTKPDELSEVIENQDDRMMISQYEEATDFESKAIYRPKQSFVLLTDGPIELRLVLHKEMDTRSIKAEEYPYLFHYIDLRKVFKGFYEFDYLPVNLYDMLKYLQIPAENIQSNSLDISSFVDSTENFQLEKPDKISIQIKDLYEIENDESSNTKCNLATVQTPNAEQFDTNKSSNNGVSDFTTGLYASKYCKAIVDLVLKMTEDGVLWNEIEEIYSEYHPAIVHKSDAIQDDVVVHARGLPWQATDSEIFKFFKGLNITNGGISLVLSKSGRRNGEAFIRFTNCEQRNLALRKHKHHIGERYIEVYAATASDFISVAAGETPEAEKFLSKVTTPEQSLIRMRGLPYTATAEDIITFFENTKCPVQFGEEGVLFVNRCDGRATGDAFVIFETQEIAHKALDNNRKHIGDRYIELFKATPSEVNQVMNSVMNPLNNIPNVYLNVSDQLAAAAGAVNTLLHGSVDCNFRTVAQPIPNSPLMTDATFIHQSHANQTASFPFFNIQNLSSTIIPPTNNLCMQPVLPGFHQVSVPTIDPFLYNADLLNLLMGLSSTTPILTTNQVMPEVKSLDNNSTLPRLFPHLPSLLNIQETSAFTELNSAGTSIKSQQQLNHTKANMANWGISNQMDQLARSFVRIRGMPLNADITDILQFLQDHWRHVTLDGIHQVYDTTGQSTGEVIIQFVTETAAKLVCEQKHQTMFSKQTGGVLLTVLVEVTQCTTDELRRIIASNAKINCIIESNLLRNAINPLNLQLQSMIPNHFSENLANHMISSAANFQECSINDTNPATNPVICAQQLGLFNVPPPTLPNPNYYTNTTAPQTLLPNTLNKPVLQYGPHGIGNVICVPPNNLSTLCHLMPKSTVQGEQLCNSANYFCPSLTTLMNRDGNMLGLIPSSSNLYVQTNDWNQNTWTNLITDPTCLQTYLVPKLEVSSENYNNETGTSNSMVDPKYQADPTIESKQLSDKTVIVRIRGLPKDVSQSELAGLLNEARTNPKFVTVQLEYTSDGSPNGNASIKLRNLDEANFLLSQYGDKKLRGHRIQMSLEHTNST